MTFKPGQSGNPKGRPRTSDTHAGAITKAEKRIADHLPGLIDNMLHLANGGYERIEEEWEPAGNIYRDDYEFDLASGKTRKVRVRTYPDKPVDELVLVRRKRSIADKDQAANKYLIDRIIGKPTERKEVTGADGGPIEIDWLAVPEEIRDAFIEGKLSIEDVRSRL